MANVKFTDLANLGNITANTIVPVVESNTNYTITAANLQAYVNSTTGNVTANYFLGNGSQLTGIVSSYGDANVEALLPINIVNVAGNNISAIGNVSGQYILGNGSQLTGLPATYGNAQVAAYLPTYTGNLNPNTISASGNITGAFILGNIAAATGGYGNANVQSVLQTYSGTLTAGSISAAGNIAGNFFVGNGSQLTGITASLSGNMSGNINGNSFSITNLQNLTATGNVSGTHFGSGSNLTGIPTSIIAGSGISVSAATGAVTITNNNPTPYANANVAAYLPTYTGNLSAGNITATGNITGVFQGNGATLSNIVTSIIAGSGISVNQSTGAVTITNTGGGGGGDLIVNSAGLNYCNVGATNNRVIMQVGNSTPTVTPGTANDLMQLINQTGNCYLTLSPTGGSTLKLKDASAVFQVFGTTSTSIHGNGFVQCLNLQSSQTITTGKINATASAPPLSLNAAFQGPLLTKTGTSNGQAGEIAWDTNYIYVCTAANTWKRVSLSSF